MCGVSTPTIRRWVREGKLSPGQDRPRLLVDRSAVENLLKAKSDAVTWAHACRAIGCSEPTLQRLIADGAVTKIRSGVRRGNASLDRGSVERAAVDYKAEQRSREERRSERARTRAQPPDDENVWVPSDVAALALGITANRVRQRVAKGTLPGVVRKGKLWLRTRDVEIAAASVVFRTTTRGTTDSTAR